MIKSWFDIFHLNKKRNIILLFAFFLCLCFCAGISPASAASYSSECPSLTVLKERYQGDCFPCEIVNVMLQSFMTACSKVYDVSKEAGNKLLLLGTFLWLAFWALKKVSSFANVEPASSVQELLVFIGKIVVAFCFINAGIGALVSFAINPILGAGADFGTALLLETENVDINSDPQPENQYQGPTEVISKSVMDKILKLSESVSNEVATNLIIGNGLTCYSVVVGFDISAPLIDIHVPDLWVWLCGAAIWCVGFMLVLSVCYYLIDIPFKIGFAIIALPVVIGLWPFNLTKDKLKSVIMIAVNAAGTFLFLALSSSYAIRLISQAFVSEQQITSADGTPLSGKEAIFEAFNTDNMEYINGLFDFTGPSFLILLFCYIYAYKLIGDITTKYPDMFFGGSMTQSAGSPLHHMATAATMALTNKAAAPFKAAANIAAYQAGKAATTVAKAGLNIAGGAATNVAGKIAAQTGGLIKNSTQKWVKNAQDLKDTADSLALRGKMDHIGIGGKIKNKIGQLHAGVKLGLAKTANSMAQGVENVGKKAEEKGAAPFQNIKDAFVSGKQELMSAAAEVKKEATTPTTDTLYSDKRKYAESLQQLKKAVPISKAKENIKKVFSKAGLKSSLQAGKSALVEGLKNYGQTYKSDYMATIQRFKQSKGHLKDTVQNYKQNLANNEKAYRQNIQNDMINAGRSFSLKNLKQDIIHAGESFQDTWEDSDTVLAKKRTENVLKSNTVYMNDAKGLGHVVRPGVALIKTAGALTNDTVDTAYNLSEKAILTTIDVAKTLTIPGKFVSRPIAHTAFALADVSRMAAAPILQAGGNVVNLADAAYQSSKLLTTPFVTSVGVVAGLAAKSVDTAFGATYGLTVKPLVTTGRVVGLSMKTLYRGFKANTKVGRGYTKAMRVGSQSLRTAGKFLNIGRNTILAAAGENDFDDRALGDKSKQKERKEKEKQQRKKEQQRKEKERKEKERKEEQERQRQKEEEKQRQAEEQERQREEEKQRKLEEKEEEERRKKEEDSTS